MAHYLLEGMNHFSDIKLLIYFPTDMFSFVIPLADSSFEFFLKGGEGSFFYMGRNMSCHTHTFFNLFFLSDFFHLFLFQKHFQKS